MKLSFFMMPMHGRGRDYHTTLKEDIEAFKLADELGFAEGWVGEHYSCDIEQVKPENGSRMPPRLATEKLMK